MQQSTEERLALAEEAARHSSLIAGVVVDRVHVELMRNIMGCETRNVAHPVIFNSPLCGYPHQARYRTGLRAAALGIIPEAHKVKSIIDPWWEVQVELIKESDAFPADFRERIAWQIHDFFLSLEPFAEANGRTARLLYFQCVIALDLPVKLITVEKAAEYADNQRRYRQNVFTPLMRSQGHLD